MIHFAIYIIVTITLTQSQASSLCAKNIDLVNNSKGIERIAKSDSIALVMVGLSQLISSEDEETALDYLKIALKSAESDSILGLVWDGKGRLYFLGGFFELAEEAFNQARNYFEVAGQLKKSASANNRIGVSLLRQKKHQKAFEVFMESAAFFESIGDEINLAMCHTNMAGIFADTGDHQRSVEYNEMALTVFQNFRIQQYEIITLTNLAGQYLKLNDLDKSLTYNKKAEALGEKLNDSYALGIIYNNLGQFAFSAGEYPLALEYYEKSLESKMITGTASDLVPTYNNLGQIHIFLGNPDEAIRYLHKGLSLTVSEERWPLLGNLSKAYIAAGQPDSAIIYFDRTLAAKDSIFSADRQKVIDELRTLYEKDRMEFEIARLQSVQNQNRLIFFGVSILLASSLVITLLFLKNNNKKRRISEQNEKIEKQRMDQLMREQEWLGIKAMMTGREHEREKISEELHDQVGSLLATLKLYLDSLGLNGYSNEFKKLHEKANHILNLTYDHVRDMAHTKRKGVLIHKGLLPAIEAMAENISLARNIQITVTGTKYNSRMEAETETGIFKSVQELLSNVIKHSHASFVEVSLTQNDDLLSIAVRDNGQGFDTANTSWGQGFTTIRQRMHDLKGEFIVKSSINSGTSVFLNIPFG
ncbi:MAG: hypothetical protein EA359_04480 [Balneolaceae bacterium]|nr:MAG: hypothetical protein EA359_04480 [Balneolaceae bacterium]